MTFLGRNKNWLLGIVIASLLTACSGQPWNNPYPSSEEGANIYYSFFTEPPKTLDPAKSYTTEEAIFVAQVYETIIQYDYLKRPYTLIPQTAVAVPKPILLDKQGKVLPANAPFNSIASSIYRITIKPGIYYQPHPAFARKTNGQYYYLHLTPREISGKFTISDFPHTGTRELVADDYIYQIKRLADPRVQSPIFGLMSNYIEGFAEYNTLLTKKYDEIQKHNENPYLDLREFPLSGAQAIDKYTYTIKIKGFYPQFIFWLQGSFFAPMPWEADAFFSQAGMENNNLTLDWYPIGTGPYMLTENNPNRRMVLTRNPNFRPEYYPTEGTPEDAERGLLKLAGQRLPFIDKIVYSLEKETIPRWNKFLQGYYDQSIISAESFDQAIHINPNGKVVVSPLLQQKNITLQTTTLPAITYYGFNMLDPVVGGSSERTKKLRQAISIAIDTETYITIFNNGRGIPAQGPIPPGIFGYKEGKAGFNPIEYKWENNQLIRRPISDAKQLLKDAGLANGRDPKTNEPLLLYVDAIGGRSSDDQSYYNWLSNQFAKIGLQLQVRDTQFNRFQEKIRTGQTQIFTWTWIADYPDPENFLFQLYGPNGKVKYGGENSSNYQNDKYDKLFLQMRYLPNGPKRQAVIDQMLSIVRQDAPWIYEFHPQVFELTQSWVWPVKPMTMDYGYLKFIKIDPQLRAKLRQEWNQPIFWPIGIFLVVLICGLIPVFISYHRKLRQPFKK